MKSEKKEYYEAKYSDVILTPSPYFLKQFKYIVNGFFKPQKKEISILDLGGGTGEYSLLLQDAGYTVTLFDFSQEAIEKAKDIGVFNTICADFNTYDFDNKKYDLILAKGFSLLNTDDSDDFNTITIRSTNILKENGLFIYWGQTDLSGGWTKSGWYQLSLKDLKMNFTQSLILPAFRYQLYFPLGINLGLSKILVFFKKLPRTVSLIGIIK